MNININNVKAVLSAQKFKDKYIKPLELRVQNGHASEKHSEDLKFLKSFYNDVMSLSVDHEIAVSFVLNLIFVMEENEIVVGGKIQPELMSEQVEAFNKSWDLIEKFKKSFKTQNNGNN